MSTLEEETKKHFLHVQDSIIQEMITNKGVSNPYSLAFELKGSDGVETYTKDGIIYVRPKWISVKDQLPPKDKEFIGHVLLGCNFSEKDTRKKSVQTCLWNGSKFMESCHCSGYEHDPEYIEVTHWMPLPSAPEAHEEA